MKALEIYDEVPRARGFVPVSSFDEVATQLDMTSLELCRAIGCHEEDYRGWITLGVPAMAMEACERLIASAGKEPNDVLIVTPGLDVRLIEYVLGRCGTQYYRARWQEQVTDDAEYKRDHLNVAWVRARNQSNAE